MARKRVIDPEFYLDDKLATCDFDTRIFFIGTWNFADDYGVIENNILKLKAQIFPYDDVDVIKMRDQLIKIGRLSLFTANGKEWLHIVNFLKWQKVEKPSFSRNPVPPLHLLTDTSPTPTQPVGSEVKRSKVKRSKKEIYKEKKIESPNLLKQSNVIPPPLDLVTSYCLERKNDIDPQYFINFYESKGWMIGKNKMKDWQAAIRYWEKINSDKSPKPQTKEQIEESLARDVARRCGGNGDRALFVFTSEYIKKYGCGNLETDNTVANAAALRQIGILGF